MKRRLPASGPALITGGAGFVGTNLAHRLCTDGRSVIIFDNLSRAGVATNLAWLRQEHGDRVQVRIADVRDATAVNAAVREAAEVYHFAAQVAVTTSLESPREDFDINALGTLNVLEALRRHGRRVPLLFTSTNKVYGDLQDVELVEKHARYEPAGGSWFSVGVSEQRTIHFHSPYGCSKGAADQYVLDYARTYGLPATVFRMSCIYGPHQFGTEDQGWVAHFLLRALRDEPITLYGDGKQVRDILYVEDLVDAMLLAQGRADELAGQAFNLGGGSSNSVSLLELMTMIAQLHGRQPQVKFADWRTADQRYYVSDTRRFTASTGWKTSTSAPAGVAQLYRWLAAHRSVGAPGRGTALAEPTPLAASDSTRSRAAAPHPLA